VIADADCVAPAFVVPAHTAADLDLARRHNLVPVEVLDADGTVVAPGPLAGLSRYAARQAATDLLGAEGLVRATTPVDEDVSRCRRCGTVLVSQLGRHWFLPMTDLEVLAADAVRQGVVTVVPAAAGDALVAATGNHGDWCLSHQVWSGQPVPVATCLDCGQAAVSVEPASSCGKCMGTLVPDDDVLDARFVGAVWPLALAGWPADQAGPSVTAPSTVLVIAPTGLFLWGVRMMALGFRLAGTSPFGVLAVHGAVDPLLHLEVVGDDSSRPDDAVEAALVVDAVAAVGLAPTAG
jgi:valyl-tRNA synthetase